MLRKILFCFLFVLILLISATYVLRYFVNICDEYLLPESGAFSENVVEDSQNKTIDYLFAIESEHDLYMAVSSSSAAASATPVATPAVTPDVVFSPGNTTIGPVISDNTAPGIAGSETAAAETDTSNSETETPSLETSEPSASTTAPGMSTELSAGNRYLGTPANYSAVIGRLLNEDCYYYTIYESDGDIAAKGKFGSSTDSCAIQDIRTTDNKISIVCEENGTGTLYEISLLRNSQGESMKIEEICSFSVLFREGEFLKMILPDSESKYILVAGTQNAVLYDRTGQLVTSYTYEPKSIITSGVFDDNGIMYICGALSASEDGQGFSNGYAEAFDQNGKSMWVKQFLRDMSCISAVMECQIMPDGNLAVYGRYFDYSESEVVMTILDTKRYDEFSIYGHGIDYYVYTSNLQYAEGSAVQASVFMSKLNARGNETEMTVYSALNDFRVPSLAQQGSLNKLNADGEFMLTSAQAKLTGNDEYYLTIDGTMLTIPGNISVIYDVDNSGGLFVYLAESANGVYKMKYFSSVESFASGLEELERALKVSKFIEEIPAVLPWFFVITIGIIFLKAKNSWRVRY